MPCHCARIASCHCACHSVPCHFVSFRVISCHFVSFVSIRVISCHCVSFRVISSLHPFRHVCHSCHSYHFGSFRVIACHFVSFRVISSLYAFRHALVRFVIVIACLSARLGQICHCHCMPLGNVTACLLARLGQVCHRLGQICHCHCVPSGTSWPGMSLSLHASWHALVRFVIAIPACSH